MKNSCTARSKCVNHISKILVYYISYIKGVKYNININNIVLKEFSDQQVINAIFK